MTHQVTLPDIHRLEVILLFLGWGVFTTADIEAGSFVAEYKGDLIFMDEGGKREIEYEKLGEGSFLYFFDHSGKKYW